MQTTLEKNELILFETISDLINSLNEYIGKNYYNLQLYSRLIEKTPKENIKIIRKHNNCFSLFYTENKEAILNLDEYKINSTIKYSDKVYIDMKKIFDILDDTDKKTSWKYLLTIGAIIDPNGGTKKILDELNKTNKSDEFIESIMGEVKENINLENNADPMSVVSSLMMSGVFGKMVGNLNSKMEDESIDPKQLISSLQGMLSSLSSQFDGPPQKSQQRNRLE